MVGTPNWLVRIPRVSTCFISQNGWSFSIRSQDQLQGVCQLSGATWAFAAVKGDGSVVTWGDERKGGNSSHVQDGYCTFFWGGWVCVDCSWFLVDVCQSAG